MWHETKKQSMWDGKITAWCGATQKAGRYETDTFYVWKSGPKCEGCKNAKKAAKKS